MASREREMQKTFKKSDFDYRSFGSYKSSNHFPYGFTFLADLDSIVWGDEEPKHPEAIEEIGPFKVLQKTHSHAPKHDWGYGGYEAHDVWEIIMVAENGRHLVLDCRLYDPADWRVVEAKAA